MFKHFDLQKQHYCTKMIIIIINISVWLHERWATKWLTGTLLIYIIWYYVITLHGNQLSKG